MVGPKLIIILWFVGVVPAADDLLLLLFNLPDDAN